MTPPEFDGWANLDEDAFMTSKIKVSPATIDWDDVTALAAALEALKLAARIAKDSPDHNLVKGKRSASFCINDSIQRLEEMLGIAGVSSSANYEAIMKRVRTKL